MPNLNILAKTCIKLNDIAAATVELDRLYFQMDVDKWANGNSALSEGQAVKTKKSLYTIKVARADLGDRFYDEQASLRARVELSDESGRQIALTRTVPTDTAFPRCKYSGLCSHEIGYTDKENVQGRSLLTT